MHISAGRNIRTRERVTEHVPADLAQASQSRGGIAQTPTRSPAPRPYISYPPAAFSSVLCRRESLGRRVDGSQHVRSRTMSVANQDEILQATSVDEDSAQRPTPAEFAVQVVRPFHAPHRAR